MKVLFVCSGNSKYHEKMPAFIRTQANSLIELGIDLDFFQIKGKGVQGYIKNIIPLMNKLKDKNYDVIHAHYGFCGVVASIARRKEKLVVSFMGESEFKPDPEDTLNPFIWFMTFLHRFSAKYLFNFVVFKSENLARFVKDIKYKSAILPNGVNLDVFKPIDQKHARKFLGLPLDKKIVLWIGDKKRLVKGYELAAAAIEKVKNHSPDLFFLPVNQVPNEVLPYYYNAADVFLLSSQSEGSPNVVKEAMACNCPVVATNVGDVRNLFNSTKGCKMSNSFSSKEISELINELIRTGQRSNGLARIKSLKLDSKLVANDLLKIYTQLIK